MHRLASWFLFISVPGPPCFLVPIYLCTKSLMSYFGHKNIFLCVMILFFRYDLWSRNLGHYHCMCMRGLPSFEIRRLGLVTQKPIWAGFGRCPRGWLRCGQIYPVLFHWQLLILVLEAALQIAVQWGLNIVKIHMWSSPSKGLLRFN